MVYAITDCVSSHEFAQLCVIFEGKFHHLIMMLNVHTGNTKGILVYNVGRVNGFKQISICKYVN
jgi:hypothetical protein